jgi:hypothetical protein
MKIRRLIITACLAAATASAASDAVRVSLQARLRYEGVQQTGLRDAEAFTLRTRLGIAPAPWRGWTALLEAENVAPIDGDRYSQAGLNPGGAGRAVVADPEGTAISQAWAAYTRGDTTLTAGRQRLVLDNARFIGDSGWRQHPQTVDGFVLRDRSFADTTLTYAYLDRINRVFGDRHPQGYWRSDSHLFNARYAGIPGGTLAAYAYLLDFSGAGAASSCATYGASFSGERKLPDGLKLVYRAELATHSDHGGSPLDYAARYQLLEAGLDRAGVALILGHEVLGAGGGVGFKTPLATLHAFNGWADLFPTTPATGLRDTYARISTTLPGKVSLVAVQHWLAADRGGADPGDEFDLQCTRQFGRHFSALVKYANFRHEAAAFPDVEKFWAQVEFTF